MSLLTDLKAHWKLNAASGTRVDSEGTNDLTDNNTVLDAAGKIGQAAQFVRANTEFLNIVDNTDLSTGDIDFMIAVWAYFDSKPAGAMGIVSKWGSPDNEYLLRWNNVNDRFEFFHADAVDNEKVVADVFGAPTTGVWLFVIVWHDAAANTLNIQVNNGTADSLNTTLNPQDGGTDFRIGIHESGFGPFDGRIDSVSFWKRVLTAQERTDLYNGGAGLDYPFDVGIVVHRRRIEA